MPFASLNLCGSAVKGAGRGQVVRVLVVEDEFLVRTFTVEAMLDEGYQVSEAGTGAEALALMVRAVPPERWGRTGHY